MLYLEFGVEGKEQKKKPQPNPQKPHNSKLPQITIPLQNKDNVLHPKFQISAPCHLFRASMSSNLSYLVIWLF